MDYYLWLDEKTGPFSAEEIKEMWRERKFMEYTLIWHDDLPDWVPFSEIRVKLFLTPSRSSALPPLPSSNLINCYDCNHKISRMAKSCPNCGAPSASERDDAVIRKKFEAQGFNLSGATFPKCPICQSRRIGKLTIADRLLTSGFIGTAGKSMKCSACGATF